jgi:tetratricopeptide (TPR) repeat protein
MPANRQRLRAFLATIRSAQAGRHPDVYLFDRAISDAIQINDRSALAELYFRRGALHRWIDRFHEAVRDYAGCLRVLDELQAAGRRTDPLMEQDACLALAGLHLMLDPRDRRFDRRDDPARRYLAQAEALPTVVGSASRAATIAWIRALILRWEGRSDVALLAIRAAARAMEPRTDPLTDPQTVPYVLDPGALGQVLLIQADCALDVAAYFPPDAASRAREALVAEADGAAERGLALLRGATDEVREEIALLTIARVDRMGAHERDFLPTLESVAATAERTRDTALLIQAQTALADHLAAQGQLDAARNVYLRAVETAARSEMPAMGFWASRAVAAHDR